MVGLPHAVETVTFLPIFLLDSVPAFLALLCAERSGSAVAPSLGGWQLACNDCVGVRNTADKLSICKPFAQIV
jgi:hypothetical protein